MTPLPLILAALEHMHNGLTCCALLAQELADRQDARVMDMSEAIEAAQEKINELREELGK